MAKIIDGNFVSDLCIRSMKKRVELQVSQNKRPPGIAVIFIGGDPISKIYINRKKIICKEVGFVFKLFSLEESVKELSVLKLIDDLNSDFTIDGIIIQLPVPKNLNLFKLSQKINPNKDVDGFHVYNIGCLYNNICNFYPCAPKAVITLLQYYKINFFNTNALVVGASNNVGKPMGLRLLLYGCTVTIAHSLTLNLEFYVKNADLLIVAVGKANYIPGNWIKQGAIVVDIGMNRSDDGKICGDVCFDDAKKVAKWITPVPGGVGPVTVTELIKSTMFAYEKFNLNN